jgi:hypothetical protein
MELNADRTIVKVLVTSDFEHRCFSINFEVVQIVIEMIRDILDDQHKFESITEILKRIGVITTSAGVVIGSVFGFLKWRKGRKIEQIRESPEAIIVKVEGDNNTVYVDKRVYRLSQNGDVLKAIDTTLAPVKSGNEVAIEFREEENAPNTLAHDDVVDIIASCEARLEPITILEEPEKPETIVATLYVYGPVFDAKAPNWRFLYRRKPIYADVRETTIASDALKRGGSLVNDRYKVRMEVTPPATPDGTPHYKIVEVLEFTPAEQQIALPLRKQRRKRSSASRT